MRRSAARDTLLRAPRVAIVAVYLMSGCLGQDTVPPEGAIGPQEITLGAALEVESEPLVGEAVQFTAPLSDHSVVAARGEMLLHRDILASAPVEVGDDAGTVRAAAVVAGELLVAGSEGLFVLVDGALERSPLDESFEPGAVLRLISVEDGDQVWLATESEIFRWRDGLLDAFESEGLDLGDVRLAYGAPVDGEPALWALADGTVHAWLPRGKAFEARPLDLPGVQSMAIDGSGTMWLVAGDTLLRRDIDGALVELAFPQPLQAVFAGNRGADLWLSDGKALWHHAAGTFSPVAGQPDGDPVAVDELGRLLISADEGVTRVSVGRALVFLGLEEGDALEQITAVTFAPALPDTVETVQAVLGKADLEVQENPWRVTLDPATLSDGDHRLEVTTTYADGGVSLSTLYFHKGALVPSTWGGQIEPLFQDRCNYCHGADGGAHRLDSALAWKTEIDDVLQAVRTGAMPRLPPRLTEDEIAMIERWRAGGFP